MLVNDRQSSVNLTYNQKTYSFSHCGKVHELYSLDEVHKFFRKNTDLDSIKFTCDGQKHYAHFFEKEVEVFSTKKALRRTLCQEGGGAWVEEKGGKKRYFVEEKGWLSTNFKEVEAKDCVEPTSTWQKVLGLGLGMLAIAPGVSEFLRHVPITKEAAMGALALQQRSPLGGLFALSMMPSEVFAQNTTNSTEFQVSTYTTSAQWQSSVAGLKNGGFVVTWASAFAQDGDGSGIFGQKYGARGFPAGGEFQVNSYVTNSQTYPSVAALKNGGFVVAWQSNVQDGSITGIYGQRYDEIGIAVGSEFQVNTYTIDAQQYPSVAALEDGGFVVTWGSNLQDGDNYGIYAQRYDGNGQVSGSEFQINNFTSSIQHHPRVAALTDGGFVVTWYSDGQDGDLWGIYGQRYNVSSNAVGNEFQVNNYTMNSQRFPRIASLNIGEFVVAWESIGQDGDGNGIYGQRFHMNGTKVGAEFQVNTYTVSSQLAPDIAALSDGGFVVVWVSVGQDGSSWGIYGQRYDVNGTKMGAEFQVNDYTTLEQRYPSVAALVDEGFVVTWESDGQDGDNFGIYGKRYDVNGNPVALVSTEFQVNSHTQDAQDSTRVVELVNGEIVVVWESGGGQDGDSNGVYGQMYYPNGTKASSEFLINTEVMNAQSQPSIAPLTSGGFVVTWQSNLQDTSSSGVYAQRFDRSGTPVDSEFQVNTYTLNGQQNPSVSGLSNGGFVITWTSLSQDGDSWGNYLQKFDANGTPIGLEQRVNTYTTADQNSPEVLGLPGNEFVVVWQSSAQDGDSGGIYGQFYNYGSGSVGSEFQVNNYTVGAQASPNLAELPNGEFVVVWDGSDYSNTGVEDIFGQRYYANRTLVGSEFQINSFVTGAQRFPSVASLVDGGFVVSWTTEFVDGNSDAVVGQRFNNSGVKVGGEFQVNSYRLNQQAYSSVTGLSDGGFLIAWQSSFQDGSSNGVYGQRFDVDGNPISMEISSPTPTLPTTSAQSSAFSTLLSSSTISDADSNTIQRSEGTELSASVQTFSPSISPQSFSSTQLTPSTNSVNSISSPSSNSTVPVTSTNPSSPSPSSSPIASSQSLSSTPAAPVTSSNSPIEESSEAPGGFPSWAGAVIGGGITACLGILGILGYKKHKGKKGGEDLEKNPVKMTGVPPARLEGFTSSQSPSSSSETSESSSGDDQDLQKSTSVKESSDNKGEKLDQKKVYFEPEYENKPVQNEDLFEKNGILNLKNRHKETLQVKLLRAVSPEDIQLVRSQTGYLMKEKTKWGITGYFIAMGNFGVVWIGQEVDGEKRFVAVKEIRGVQAVNESKREGKLLYKLREAPNIIPFYGESGSDDWMFQATHLAGFGDGMELAKKLGKLKPDSQSKVLVDVAKCLLNGVCAMHERHIYHLDLKWENVVFDLTGETFIIDFGSARELSDGNLQKYVQGDSNFFSPEYYARNKKVQEKKVVDPISVEKVDAWSVGTCLLNLVKRRNCFEGQGASVVNGQKGLNRDPKAFETMLSKELEDLPVSDELANVIEGLLVIDSEERMSPQDAKKELSGMISYQDLSERMADFAKMKGLVVQKK